MGQYARWRVPCGRGEVVAKTVKPNVSTLAELHEKLMKSWRYRFWYYAYAPRFWVEDQVIRFRIWRRQRSKRC